MKPPTDADSPMIMFCSKSANWDKGLYNEKLAKKIDSSPTTIRSSETFLMILGICLETAC